MTDNAGGYNLGSAHGEIGISTAGIVNAQKVVEKASAGMTKAMQQIDQGANVAERGLNKVEQAVSKASQYGNALSGLGRAMKGLDLPGGGLLEASGKSLNAINGIKRVDSALQSFMPKLAESGGLIGGLVEKFGGLIAATTGLSVGLSGVLAVALPAVGVLGALTLAVSQFKDVIEQGRAAVEGALADQVKYYEYTGSHTSEEAKNRIAEVKIIQDANQRALDNAKQLLAGLVKNPEQIDAAIKEGKTDSLRFDYLNNPAVMSLFENILKLQGAADKAAGDMNLLAEGIKRGDFAARDAIDAQKATLAQDEAYVKHKEANAEIDARANEQILEAQADYQAKRVVFEKEYVAKITKFDAEESKRHKQALADNDKQIQAIRDNAGQREVEAEQEVAKTRDQARKDELRAESDHLREMRDMAAEHRENLLEAAARLDARAVFEELKNYGQRKSQAEDNYKSQRDRERESTAEHIRSIQARVEADNAADAARIEKMRADFAEQEALRQDEAKARRQELIEQGNEESRQIDKQFNDRIRQIDQQHTKELNAENTRFINEFNALGVHNGRMVNLYKEGLDAAEREIQAWVLREQARATAAAQQAGYTGPLVVSGPVTTVSSINPNAPTVTPLPPPPVTYTPPVTTSPYIPTKHIGGAGRAGGTNWSHYGDILHEGEIVANRPVSDLMRAVLGANFSQADLASAFRGGGRGVRDINVSVPISGLGQDVREIARQVGTMVESRLIAELEAMGG